MAPVRTAASVLAIVLCATAQTPVRPPAPSPPKPEDLSTVEGRVTVDQTEQPLGKVSLELIRMEAGGGGRNYASSSGPDGTYIFKGIEAGKYRLSALRNGYVRAEYGSSGPTRPGTTIVLEKGQNLKSLSLKMIPHAVIAGRVLDGDGEPLAGIYVRTVRPSFLQGKRTLLPLGFAQTNDLGEYRLFGIPAGRYLVSASQFPGGRRENSIDASGREGEESNVTTYHPSAIEPEQGSWISVSAGGRLQGVDITMAKVRTYTIKGRVSGVPGADASVSARLWPQSGEVFSGMEERPVHVDAKGAFQLTGVRPGAYYIEAESYQVETQMSGRAGVEVRDGDVANLSVTLQAAFGIKGTVRLESGDGKIAGANVILEPKEIAFRGGAGGVVKEDGSTQIRFVRPAKYRIRMARLPEGHYLKSARFGTADALAEDFEMTSAGELEIVVSPHGAKIEGTVKNAKGEPAQGATIVVLGEKGFRPTQPFLTSDQSGRFAVSGLPPGTYHVLAITDYEFGIERMPDFLKLNSKAAEKVTVKERSVEPVELKAATVVVE